MNFFSPFTGGDRERRLIRNAPGSDFQNQPSGMPSYEQLLTNNRLMAQRLQRYDRMFLEGQITPRDARDQAAKQQLNAQQQLWNRMGGQFALGASPPQFYYNIGSRARYWNAQMQHQQYRNPHAQHAQGNNLPAAPQTNVHPLPPQPVYLTGLGRDPDALPYAPPYGPPALPYAPPGPPRGVRRVMPRGPRRGPSVPLTQPVFEFDDQGNPMLHVPEHFTVLHRGLQHPGGPVQDSERFGKLSTERQGGQNVRREELRKMMGMLRAMSQFMSPEERKMVEAMISTFEQLVTSAERMESAAQRGNLKEAQQHAQDVQARLQGLWTILPQDVRKMLGQVLQKEGLLSGTEPLGQFELAWNIDSNFNAPTIQVRPRTGGGSVGGRGGAGVNYTGTGPAAKQQYEKNLKGGTDPSSSSGQAKRKEEGANKSSDQRLKAEADKKLAATRLKERSAELTKLLSQVEELEKQAKKRSRDLTEFSENHTKLEENTNRINGLFITLADTAVGLRKQITSIETDRKEFSAGALKRMAELRKEATDAAGRGEFDVAKKHIAEVAKIEASVTDHLAEATKRLNPLNEQMQKVSTGLTEIQEEFDTARKFSDNSAELRKKLTSEIANFDTQIATINKTIARLRTEIASR